jgi:hypothetical protein
LLHGEFGLGRLEEEVGRVAENERSGMKDFLAGRTTIKAFESAATATGEHTTAQVSQKRNSNNCGQTPPKTSYWH